MILDNMRLAKPFWTKTITQKSDLYLTMCFFLFWHIYMILFNYMKCIIQQHYLCILSLTSSGSRQRVSPTFGQFSISNLTSLNVNLRLCIRAPITVTCHPKSLRAYARDYSTYLCMSTPYLTQNQLPALNSLLYISASAYKTTPLI